MLHAAQPSTSCRSCCHCSALHLMPVYSGAGLPAQTYNTSTMSLWRPNVLKVFMSNRYTYASILQKATPSDGGHYVAAASTLQKDIKQALQEANQSRCDVRASALIGKVLAEKAKAANVQEVHFDNHKQLRYQGKLKALIESLRSNGVSVK